MRKFGFALLTLMLTWACHLNAQKPAAFSFIAIGDMPYFVPDDYARMDNVIRTINRSGPAFTIHVGDFKSSIMPCSDEYYARMVQYFNTFEEPLIYTPGDNEWTDCNKAEAGSYDPHERLEVIRKLFYSDGKSFGRKKISLRSQSTNSTFARFVENNIWDYMGVQFATLHVVGTSNNKIPEEAARLKEFEERDEANLAWLKQVFKSAKGSGKLAIVISMQADMFNPNKGKVGFENMIIALTSLSLDFGRPVLLINGDSHKFIVDKPLLRDIDQKINKARVVENFTRLQLFGEQDMHAVRVHFNPKTPGGFQIEQLLVPGN